MEVLHDLIGYKDLKIYEDTESFSFSLDSVLLARFVSIRISDKKILDLGTGTAPIPLILSYRTKALITGVEIQEKIANLAKRTIKYNHLEDQIKIIQNDMKEFGKITERESFDVITINPPYFKYKDSSIVNASSSKTIARHEILITLEEIFQVASKLLKKNGTFAMVHRAERLLDILNLYRKYNIEPKRMRFVYPKIGKDANMILIEGKKNSLPGNLKVESPLYVHDDNNLYTDMVKQYFEWK